MQSTLSNEQAKKEADDLKRANQLYAKIESLTAKDVENMSVDELKELTALAFEYSSIQSKGKRPLPSEIVQKIKTATTIVTGATENDHNYMENVENQMDSEPTIEDYNNALSAYEAARGRYNAAVNNLALHVIHEKDTKKRAELLKKIKEKHPELFEAVKRCIQDLKRAKEQGKQIGKPQGDFNGSLNNAGKALKIMNERKKIVELLGKKYGMSKTSSKNVKTQEYKNEVNNGQNSKISLTRKMRRASSETTPTNAQLTEKYEELKAKRENGTITPEEEKFLRQLERGKEPDNRFRNGPQQLKKHKKNGQNSETHLTSPNTKQEEGEQTGVKPNGTTSETHSDELNPQKPSAIKGKNITTPDEETPKTPDVKKMNRSVSY